MTSQSGYEFLLTRKNKKKLTVRTGEILPFSLYRKNWPYKKKQVQSIGIMSLVIVKTYTFRLRVEFFFQGKIKESFFQIFFRNKILKFKSHQLDSTSVLN